ncbi:unnamed protein product (macronuclear) [Paramecium tetraurelia]|uniref:Uncharacterized protein n=1 Tax=Paramecium tetraurelia TaxID=5888 RepID=A0DWW3_PARTE|nr:uncharacterized protein GSPATT00021173001 [Paramecium tetraurelia]CAK87530.1 unnamed protein product [Paramecium tetraurelia]|eukprot:XP_001454927.1 hypothetical protein (macronuclear) [Paramecium tetraurelia strain d4-2]
MKFHLISPTTTSFTPIWTSQQQKRPQIKLSELAKFTQLQLPKQEDSQKALEYKQRQQQLLRQSKNKPLLKVLTKSQLLQGYLSMRPQQQQKKQIKSRSSSLISKLNSSSPVVSINESPKIVKEQSQIMNQPMQQIQLIEEQQLSPKVLKPLKQEAFAKALDFIRPETPLNFRCLVQDVSYKKHKINTKAIIRDIINKLSILKKLDIKYIDRRIWSNQPFQKRNQYSFIKACKAGDLNLAKELLEQDRFLNFGFDYVNQSNILLDSLNRIALGSQTISFIVGCDVDAQDLIGRPALYFAIEQKETNIVKLLLENNAIPWSTQKITYSKLCNDDLQIMLLLNKARKVHVIYRMVDPKKRIQIKQRALTGLFDV